MWFGVQIKTTSPRCRPRRCRPRPSCLMHVTAWREVKAVEWSLLSTQRGSSLIESGSEKRYDKAFVWEMSSRGNCDANGIFYDCLKARMKRMKRRREGEKGSRYREWERINESRGRELWRFGHGLYNNLSSEPGNSGTGPLFIITEAPGHRPPSIGHTNAIYEGWWLGRSTVG